MKLLFPGKRGKWHLRASKNRNFSSVRTPRKMYAAPLGRALLWTLFWLCGWVYFPRGVCGYYRNFTVIYPYLLAPLILFVPCGTLDNNYPPPFIPMLCNMQCLAPSEFYHTRLSHDSSAPGGFLDYIMQTVLACVCNNQVSLFTLKIDNLCKIWQRVSLLKKERFKSNGAKKSSKS